MNKHIKQPAHNLCGIQSCFSSCMPWSQRSPITNSFIDNMFWKRNVFWKHNLSSPWYSSVRSCITTYFPVVPEHSKSKTGYSNRYCQKKRFLPVSNMTHRNRTEEKELSNFQSPSLLLLPTSVLHITENLEKCVLMKREQILGWGELTFCAMN